MPASKKRSRTKRSAAAAVAEPILEGIDASLLDIVDHVLSKGIVLTGDLLLGVADVDLVYLRVSAVLCSADRILGPRPKEERGAGALAMAPAARAGGTVASRIGAPRIGGRRPRGRGGAGGRGKAP